MAHTLFFTALLVICCITIHGCALYYLEASKTKNITFSEFGKFSLVLISSHLLQIILFALFYSYSFQNFNAAALFGGNLHNNFVDFFYFSISCYTTLGIGDVYPLGEMRITAGLEALIGLVLIAWTAAFKLVHLLKINK